MGVVLLRRDGNDLTDLQGNNIPKNDENFTTEDSKVLLIISLSIIGALLLICGLIQYFTVRGRTSGDNVPRSEKQILTALRREVRHTTFGKWENGNTTDKVMADFSSPVCVICLEAIKTNDTIYHLHCDHLYHQRCMEEWATTSHPFCPLCRQPIYGKTTQKQSTQTHASRAPQSLVVS
ncbi:hypothetical protein BKA67DRAFT_582544 [Truncatella angustata]|uniref:RING-type domain-containing protein n=1 Tax=Truncatella angustata TaxID=152316 RepID=A0A9P8RM24_9PEZI|nr:uncharacterized protein BKA67DRAFT_582544 [Truncatella angustata]KAH6645855.1 hypothetical protein BKA67DRAFT_582544 [Truncatella angustata]